MPDHEPKSSLRIENYRAQASNSYGEREDCGSDGSDQHKDDGKEPERRP